MNSHDFSLSRYHSPCRHLIATVALAVISLAATSGIPARAQNQAACTQLASKLADLGKAEVTKEADAEIARTSRVIAETKKIIAGKGDKAQIDKAKADKAKAETEKAAAEANKKNAESSDQTRLGLAKLAGVPSEFRVESSSDSLPGDGQAWFAIVGAPFSDERANVCVRIYHRPAKQKSASFETTPIEQSFRFVDTEDKTPKYKVIFNVPDPGSEKWLSRNYEFLLVGLVAGEKPGDSKMLSYFVEEPVTRKAPALTVALLFVSLIYLGLAYATYDNADMGDLHPARKFIYFFSPIRITAGVLGDSSISQVQVVLFTFIVAGLLLYLWMRTGLLASISKDLLYLLGISALGAGGAKFTATLKAELDKDANDFAIAKGWYNWQPVPAAKNANLANLLLTGQRLDVYKFQVAVFTLVVAAYVLSSGQNDLGDVNISDTMLYLIGISQGVYIGGKAITDRKTLIEDAIKKMSVLEPQIADPTKKMEYEAAEQTAKREFASFFQLRQP